VLMGRPELAGGGRWGSTAERVAERDAVDACVAEWTGTQTAADLLRNCEQGQVPCGLLMSIKDIFADPHYAERENIARLSVPGLGTVAVPNVVPRLTVTPGAADSVGPALGANTDEILSQLLGLDGARLDDLRARKVI